MKLSHIMLSAFTLAMSLFSLYVMYKANVSNDAANTAFWGVLALYNLSVFHFVLTRS